MKRTMIKDVIMATWNVRTMMQPDRMQEIANDMIKNKIDILALQIFVIIICILITGI
jgi:hypothetical protein